MNGTTPTFQDILPTGNVVTVMHEKASCNKVKTARGSTYLADSVNTCGGCKAYVTAIKRCGCAEIRECGKLLYVTYDDVVRLWNVVNYCIERFPLNVKRGSL